MITRTRKLRPKSVSRGCLTGSAATLANAKADLNGQIDRALEGSYNPYLISYQDYTILAWRTPNGWEYRLMSNNQLTSEGINRIDTGCCMGHDKDKALQHAAHHVIQCGNGDYHTTDEIPAFLTDQSLRSNLLSCSRFQRAYKHAKEVSPDAGDHKWHEWACWHSNEPQFA